MRAAVVTAPGSGFSIEEGFELDSPIGYEVLVDVRASGLCHSDLKVAEQGMGVPMPIVLGHEIAGVVLEVGPLVTEFTPGDYVAACLVRSCGRCDSCRTGRPAQCLNPDAIYRRADERPRMCRDGKRVDQFWGISGFAEQVLTHENQLAKIPPEVPFDRACLLGCAVATGAGAVVNTAQVRFGDTVAVFGAGGVGLNAVQAAAACGASRVFVVDLQPAKLELAKRFGATDLVDPAEGDVVARIRAATDGLGVQHSFEVIGLKATAMQALRVLRLGGTANMVGLQQVGNPLSIDVDPDLMVGQNSIRGVHMGSTNIKRDIPLYANLYLQGRLNLDDLVSRRIALDEINAGYDDLRTGMVARSVIVF